MNIKHLPSLSASCACTLILVLLSLLPTQPASAQNPVIRDQFAADPTARVFGDRVYLYPSHDIPAPSAPQLPNSSTPREDWFCMADYHVFSSADLTDWTDHGVILTQEQVPWGKADGYSMWAPDCVEKGGKYYFYFPDAPATGRGFAVGVAVAGSPTGPFTPEAQPIKGVTGIDPCVLIDDDGQAYIYWSGMGIRGARLKTNMVELADPLQEVKMPRREGAPDMPPMMVGGQQMEGLPEGFKEGPFAFKRDGWYYLTFPWVRGETGDGKNPTETLAYAMARSPLGPWDFKGIFMAEHDNKCWTNHHSFVEYRGQWYLFYHRNDFSPAMDKRRSPRIERVTFRKDGTIEEIRQTMRGVGINKATERIDIDRYSEAGNGVTTQFVDTADTFRGWQATLPQKGSWLRYDGVDFSTLNSNPSTLNSKLSNLNSNPSTHSYLVVCAKATDNTEFFVRANSAKGKVIARVQMTVKSEVSRPGSPTPFRRDQSNQWLTLTAPLEYVPEGVTALVITCEGSAPVSIDWLQFKKRPAYFSPVPAAAQPAHPDTQGFIRRWTLLEPIRQDIRSNTVFTDSWLREAFGKTYFKDQPNTTAPSIERNIPRDGQKVRVTSLPQTLTWHHLDSETFNVRLFRFGEQYAGHTYGSLFWVVTVIDCSDDIPDVRLAAGSNGASMWWLDGQEVLLLSGDRRMVEDDGMSPRLTLTKGRHVLCSAIINGPGLSDFCIRFLDNEGRPVTSFSIQ